MTTVEHILLPVFDDASGEVVSKEMLEVTTLASGHMRLLHSPAFVDGIARGDVISLDPTVPDGYRIHERSGYLSVVLAFAGPEAKSAASAALSAFLQPLGGICEGGPGSALVCSIPVRATFPVIETAMALYCEQHTGTTWWFGNVYRRGTDEPLGWW